MSQFRRGLVVLPAAMLLVACATADGGGAGDDDGAGMPDGGGLPKPDAPVGPGLPDAAIPGPPDAGMMSMVDAGGGGTPCSSGAQCAGASMLGQVSGDTGNQMLSVNGSQSAWYRVRVSEDNSDIFGLTLRVAAKLTSPVAADFDVYVYLNEGSDVVECSTTVGQTTTTGNVNVVKAEWGETGTFSNGAEDGRFVSIEVRAVSGVCSPGQNWLLEVEGNWL
jgi:hypothetical protein